MAIYGLAFQRVAQGMDIDDVLTAPRAPWQNPFVERVIGSLRRECRVAGSRELAKRTARAQAL